jgi:hypothetical protein
MIRVSQTIVTDFDELNLIDNGAYVVSDYRDIKRLSSIKKILAFSSDLLTFRDECGIIGILGYGGDRYNPELFAYIDQKFQYHFSKEYFAFIKDMIRYILQETDLRSFRTLIRSGSKVGNRFIQALGFTFRRELVGADGEHYNEYAIWRRA